VKELWKRFAYHRLATLTFENKLQLSQILEFSDPSRHYAGGVDFSSPSGPVPVEARLISYNDKPLRPRPLPRFCSPKASKNGGGAMI